MINRRLLLKNGVLGAFGLSLGGAMPSFMANAVASPSLIVPYQRKKTLVCIFQRGAMDGLAAVSPFADADFKKARPSIYLSPASTEGQAFDLDGHFCLHPAMAALHPFFQEKRLAIVHGVGSPNNTRSHFDAQDYMESGTPFSKGTASGWLNRALDQTPVNASPFRALSMTSALPRSFYGKNEALAISRLEDFGLQAKGVQMGGMNTTGKSFEDLYDQTSSQLLNKTGKESFEAMKILKGADPKNYQPTAGVQYPVSKLGNALKQIAMLIKMEVGIEIAFAESGGWDTHFNQGAANGILARNLKDFSDCIAAFYKDLGNYQDEVTLMTMTEFGRTVKQNGTGGTDHGRASCLMVLGNDTAGGKIHHNIKSLAVADLEDGRDLPVTTDFRSVFAIVAGKHLGLVAPQKLFSDWSGIPMAELMR